MVQCQGFGDDFVQGFDYFSTVNGAVIVLGLVRPFDRAQVGLPGSDGGVRSGSELLRDEEIVGGFGTGSSRTLERCSTKCRRENLHRRRARTWWGFRRGFDRGPAKRLRHFRRHRCKLFFF